MARYYTPSGRSIQKPYKAKSEDTDEANVADSLSYYTSTGRSVNSGGGIMPDIIMNDQVLYDEEMMGASLLSLFYACNKQHVDRLVDWTDIPAFFQQDLNDKVKQLLIQFIEAREDRNVYSDRLDKLYLNLKMMILERNIENKELQAYFIDQDEAVRKAISLVSDIEQMDEILGY